MAIIKWGDPNVDGFSGELDLAINDRHTKAVYEDVKDGGKVILTGRNLKADDGVLAAGTVTSVAFEGRDGGSVVLVTGNAFSASRLGEAGASGDASEILRRLCQGDDKVIGTSGDDFLVGLRGEDTLRGNGGRDTMIGGTGDDVLIGGGGSDEFIFDQMGAGHDVIRDFDAIGIDTDSLSLGPDIMAIRAVHRWQDTLIELENGGSVLLEDVTTRQFDEFWFEIS